MRPLHQRHKIRRVRTCAARPRSSEAAKRTMSVKRPEPNWFGPFVFGLCSRVAKWQGSTLLMCLSGVRIPLREPSLKVARSFNGEDSGLWNRISGFESLTRSQSFLDRRSTAGREPLELHIRVRIPAIPKRQHWWRTVRWRSQPLRFKELMSHGGDRFRRWLSR